MINDQVKTLISKIYHPLRWIILIAVMFVCFTSFSSPSKAGSNTESSPPRGAVGDLWADIVLGKPDFNSLTPNEVTGSRLFNGGGVIVDRSTTPNRLFIYDGGNSRVLGLSHLGTCESGININQSCTVNSDCPGSSCSIQEGRSADIVLGQPDFQSSGCNGDSNFQNFPNRAPASDHTLCSMPENQISPLEGGSFANMAVDDSGDLYVPDFDNNRVLLFRSPFDTDTVADEVWGQPDFTGNGCNAGRGVGSPDERSMCLRSPTNEGFVGGVGVDAQKNLWVTDNQNNRVLRFPFDASTNLPKTVADLVLGQPDFSSWLPGTALNQLHAPAAVRINSNGSVYVADSLNNRILIFDPPLSNGMTATRVLGDNVGFRLPAGLEFDLHGNLWINDSGNNQLLRYNMATNTIDRILFKDMPDYSGRCGGNYVGDGPDFYFPGPGTTMSSYNVCDARGSIGIDIDGNIFISASTFVQDVWRFSAPFPEMTPGIAHSADAQIFKPYIIGEFNHVSKNSLQSPHGIAIWNRQIIIADQGRILFWNSFPSQLKNGQAANGVVGAPNFNLQTEPVFGPIRADARNHLWAMRGNQIQVYRLPLTNGELPLTIIQPPIMVAGGGTIDWGSYLDISGIAVSENAEYLWIGDPVKNRVFRIHNPLSEPRVDIILGQSDLNGESCNQGLPGPSAITLCHPAHVSLDLNGNLFVSDESLEVQGNFRLLEFDASLFPPNPTSVLFALPASRVYGTGGSFTGPSCQDALCGPWATAFNKSNEMVVGLNSYIGSHFPLVYQDPLFDQTPDGALNDYYSMAYFSVFDKYGNLYLADLNRSRVLIYRMSDKP